MECRTRNVAVRVLEATPGHKLHRKSESIDTAYFTDRVYLGSGDSPDNYTEIPDSAVEAEIMRREAKTDNDNNIKQGNDEDTY